MNSPAGCSIRAGCYVLPNGDVLVAESDSPGTDKSGGGIKGFFQKMLMKKAGSGTAQRQPHHACCATPTATESPRPSAPLARPASTRRSGWRCANGELFVANADALVAFPLHAGPDRIDDRAPRHVTSLPSGYNHHWTKSLVASPDGKCLLRRRRIEQQCRRKRHGDGEGPRRDLG